MEKLKFDFRLYVLVTGVNPLRVYLSKQGLTRLATKMYQPNLDESLSDLTMHLTNYAINKNELNYVQNKNAEMDSVGHKRSVKYTLKFLERTHRKDKDLLMNQIKEIIVKTMICA